MKAIMKMNRVASAVFLSFIGFFPLMEGYQVFSVSPDGSVVCENRDILGRPISPTSILKFKDAYIAAQIRDLIILRHREICKYGSRVKALDDKIYDLVFSFQIHREIVGKGSMYFRLGDLDEMAAHLGYCLLGYSIDVNGKKIPDNPRLSEKYIALKTSIEEAKNVVLTIKLPQFKDLIESITISAQGLAIEEKEAYMEFCKDVIVLYEQYVSIRQDEIKNAGRNQDDVQQNLFLIIRQLNEKKSFGAANISGQDTLQQIGYFEELKRLNSEVESNERYSSGILGDSIFVNSIQYLISEKVLTSFDFPGNPCI